MDAIMPSVATFLCFYLIIERIILLKNIDSSQIFFILQAKMANLV